MKKRLLALAMLVAVLFSSTNFVIAEAQAIPNPTNEVETALSPTEIDDFLAFIRNYMERRTQSLVSPQQMQIMTLETTQGASRLEQERIVIAETEALFLEEQKIATDIGNLRDVLSANSCCVFTHFIVDISLVSYTVDEGLVTFVVTELTRLFYDRSTRPGPECTVWRQDRQFVFRQSRNGWLLESHSLLNANEFLLPPNEPSGVSKAQMQATFDEIAQLRNNSYDEWLRELDLIEHQQIDSEDAVPRSGSFDRAAAAAYATRWAYERNPAYRDFSPRNCTNFVSQAMRAGGWTDVRRGIPVITYNDPDVWWFQNVSWVPPHQSHTWINAHLFYEFAVTHSRRASLLSSPLSLFVGEVLLADWGNDGGKDHAMVVSDRSSTTIYLASNSSDFGRRCFHIISANNPGARWLPLLIRLSFS